MALDPNKFSGDAISTPLSTGFVYRDRKDVQGFELRPEVVEAMTERLDDIEERYQRRPDDAHTFIARGAIDLTAQAE